ncbi:4'-phosphopantetheinyl transferase [Streptomyces sp. NPDC056529]|uniref:4'-phosphopantetheinyl transferase family protein n=1 Tax=Streptomyces sp. NPDC056529 TaxID=3345855 RepID=UPI00368AC59F
MIEEILPPGTVSADTAGEHPPELLFAGERALIRDAVEERRREFATVRVCAHRALAALGRAAEPVLTGRRGEPLWPAGTVGSLTHCEGYRGAALASADRWRSLGIDAEPHLPLPPGVTRGIASAAERERLRELARRHPGTRWDRLLFSAKESLFKAWSPLTRRALDFDSAELALDPAARTFTARLRIPGPVLDGRALTELTGRWTVTDGLLLTAVAVRGPRTAAAGDRPAPPGDRPAPPQNRPAPSEPVRAPGQNGS